MLKITYPKKEDVPAEFISLFTEKAGVYSLTEIEGIKTTEDIERLTGALTLEKKEHKETKEKWKTVTDLNIGAADVVKSLEEYEDLKVKVEAGLGKEFDQGKFDEAVAKRVEREQGKWERERKQLLEKISTGETNVLDLTSKINKGKIETEVLKVCTDLGVKPTAVQDALLLAERVMLVNDDGTIQVKDQVGYTPGLGVKEFVEDRKQDRSHWWEGSTGGGSKTKNGLPAGVNPFKPETRSLAAQGELFRTNPQEARRLANEAGVKLHE